MSSETDTCNCENHNCENCNCSNPGIEQLSCCNCSKELNVTEEEYKAEDIFTQELYNEIETFLKSKGIIQYAFMGIGEIQTESIREKYKDPQNHPVKILNKFECSSAFIVDRTFEMISQNPEALYHFSSLLFSKMHQEDANEEDIIPD